MTVQPATHMKSLTAAFALSMSIDYRGGDTSGEDTRLL